MLLVLIQDLSGKVLPRSKLGEAVGYALAQWSTLTRYVEIGEAEIDNNSVEKVLPVEGHQRHTCGRGAG